MRIVEQKHTQGPAATRTNEEGLYSWRSSRSRQAASSSYAFVLSTSIPFPLARISQDFMSLVKRASALRLGGVCQESHSSGQYTRPRKREPLSFLTLPPPPTIKGEWFARPANEPCGFMRPAIGYRSFCVTRLALTRPFEKYPVPSKPTLQPPNSN